jgi:1-acyl-sn-glycerol-3-phosphate acyltransferase
VPAPAPAPAAARDETFRGPQRIARQVIGAGFRATTKLDVEGLHHFPASGGCIVAANHLSLMDVPLLFSVLPRPTVLFASEHLRNSAVMRRILTDFGDTIWVRRGEGDQDALHRGLTVLKDGGVLGIGPEGTRSRTGGLGRAHSGPAYLAARSGAPIVPIAMWGQEKMRRGWASLNRPPIYVRIGPPIVFPLEPAPDAARLADMTGTIMTALAALLPAAYRGLYAE